MKKLIISALILMLTASVTIGCGSKNENKTENNKKAETTEKVKNDDTNDNTETSNNENTDNENTNNEASANVDERVAEVKNYIINDQDGLSEAEKIQWSKSFLNATDVKSLYNDYIKSVSNNYDVKAFAEYITKNAPILDNWQELFKQDVKDTYGQDIVKIESVGGDMYQAYINNEGNEVPYVGVNARTGYFHG